MKTLNSKFILTEFISKLVASVCVSMKIHFLYLLFLVSIFGEVSILGEAGSPTGLSAEDWPGFRGPNRDGRSQTTEISVSWKSEKPELVKEFGGAGNGFASLCIGGGHIYTTGNSIETRTPPTNGNAAEGANKSGSKKEERSPNTQFVVCFDLNGRFQWKKDLVNVHPNHAIMGSRSTRSYVEHLL